MKLNFSMIVIFFVLLVVLMSGCSGTRWTGTYCLPGLVACGTQFGPGSACPVQIDLEYDGIIRGYELLPGSCSTK
ncbi:MAG: hypothetical protein UW68_C0019G0016 [Candidatus Collierbacteria bacterium GW2011_GWB1_44_6]|uniref:Lipoprotein n=2 Tax=Candidatus Collieribacteriota TaxID=1752725 RepID=A0A0G1LW04_9BACT|nr:MAG: hypothetical protein UV68_C0036G0014 [Candidatus Collierbacteria bacterium GW2011_GWC2_43_12]KKT73002.1 MAG: hypothetical protein UW68_C0019G0016 [Candidatus Collierbacteria bacterium GW2011_GWB1_44_6]KKT82877.1 MAG: hypothetical protein UW80_C0028G0009 [Microgenomates group bacterium GW2011_GWC1_44_9]